MVSILEKDDGTYMPESLDIIEYINDIGENKINTQLSSEVQNWLNGCNDYFYRLCMPRWAAAPLEEFATESAKAYFINKKEAYVGPFKEQLDNSATLIELAENQLNELNQLLKSKPTANAEFSMDDIEIYTILRGLSIVKNLNYPELVEEYRLQMAKLTKVPLHVDISI